MTAQELKNSILQLAVEGKLAPHTNENASEILGKIKTEKAKLITEGKIKKEKDLPPIAENEKPFDIPENWCWCRLGEICETQLGKTLDKARNTGNFYPYLCSINVDWGKFDLSTVKQLRLEPNELEKYIVKKGDLLICEGGEVGRCAIWDSDEVIYYQNALHRVRCFGNINHTFIMYLLQLYKSNKMIDNVSKGVTIKHLVQGALLNLPIPLPPLSEQKAIVAKIEELLPYIEKYDAAYTKLEEFNKKFPQDMQKSILQQAVQGKLVPQNKADGNAKDLLAQIKAEKAKLIAEGKIKKEKPLAEITEDEIPFDIPDNWCWCRLGEIVTKLTDGTHSTPKYTSEGIPFLSVKDMSSGILDFSNCKYISRKEHEELFSRCNPKFGDLLLTKVGTTGIPVIVDTHDEFSLFVSVALLKFNQNLVFNKFLKYLIKSPLVQVQAKENTKGVGNKNWVMNDIANTIIVLPPLAEQKRIVAKIEELLPLCKKLEKK